MNMKIETYPEVRKTFVKINKCKEIDDHHKKIAITEIKRMLKEYKKVKDWENCYAYEDFKDKICPYNKKLRTMFRFEHASPNESFWWNISNKLDEFESLFDPI